MGIIIKRTGYTALLSYLGFFIGYINMLWLFPYAFRPEEIGLIKLMLAVAAMFTVLSSFGGSQVAIKFFPYFSDTLQRRSTFFKLLSGIAFAGLTLFIVFFILFHNTIQEIYSSKSALFNTYLWYVIPITGSLIIYGIVESFVTVQGYPTVPAFFREIYTRILLTIATLIFIASLISFSGFMGLVCILYCLSPIILFFYGREKGLMPSKGPLNNIHRNEIRELSQFGAFAYLGNAGAVILANIDSVVLSAYSGLIGTGIYGIALFITVIIEIPKRSLSQVLIPMVVKANKEHDVKILDVLYKKSSINQFLVGAFVFLIIWLNIDGIFSLIPNGEIYREGKWVVFLISLAKLFDMFTGINAEIVGTSQYYKIDLLLASIISIIGVVLNFLLIPLYGVIGAALAVLFSIVLLNTTRFVFIAIAMKIQPFSAKTFIALLCVAITYGIVYLIPVIDGTIIEIIIRTLLIGVIFGGLILCLHVSEDISQAIIKIFVRLSQKT
jgi:O-antigen/teichoic acid export membrane protein